MKIKCEDCSHIQEISLDILIFDGGDEEVFATYLATEFSKSQSKDKEEIYLIFPLL